MAYATPQQFEDIYTTEQTIELTNLGKPGATDINLKVLNNALTSATNFARGYVNKRFPNTTITDQQAQNTPLADCVCALSAEQLDLTFQARQQWIDAANRWRKWLNDLVLGNVELGIVIDPPTTQGIPALATRATPSYLDGF